MISKVLRGLSRTVRQTPACVCARSVLPAFFYFLQGTLLSVELRGLPTGGGGRLTANCLSCPQLTNCHTNCARCCCPRPEAIHGTLVFS